MYSWNILCLIVVVSFGGGFYGNNSSGSDVAPVDSSASTWENSIPLLEDFYRRYKKFHNLTRQYAKKEHSIEMDGLDLLNITRDGPPFLDSTNKINLLLIWSHTGIAQTCESLTRALEVVETGTSDMHLESWNWLTTNQSEATYRLQLHYNQTSWELDLAVSKLSEMLDTELDALYNITADRWKSQDAVDAANIEKQDQILAIPPTTGWWLWKKTDERAVNAATEAKSLSVSRRAKRNDYMKMIFDLINQLRNECSTTRDGCIKDREVFSQLFTFFKNENDKRTNSKVPDEKSDLRRAFLAIPKCDLEG